MELLKCMLVVLFWAWLGIFIAVALWVEGKRLYKHIIRQRIKHEHKL